VREGVEHLGARLDGRPVVEDRAAQGLPQRPALDIGVGDVDVAVVSLEGEGPQAAWMAQPGRRLHLALRARPGLAFAGDDLERDVASQALVPDQPD